jgi:hypothetical protein
MDIQPLAVRDHLLDMSVFFNFIRSILILTSILNRFVICLNGYAS